MKFRSMTFPNVTVHGKGLSMRFVNGIYETSDKKEIEILKLVGYPVIDENTMEEKEEQESPNNDLEVDETIYEEMAKEFHKGGGYYEINGEKLRGKEKAIDFLKSLGENELMKLTKK